MYSQYDSIYRISLLPKDFKQLPFSASSSFSNAWINTDLNLHIEA